MVKKIYDIVSTLIVMVIVVVALSIVAVKFIGAGAYTVLSGSMEPTYHVGSLIYTKKVDVNNLQIGDPITFALSEDLAATHRIVDIIDTDDGLAFVTKGDANDSTDAQPVNYRNVIGKPMFSVPYLGYAIDFIKRPPGMFIAIAACALIILISIIKSMMRS